MLGKIKTEVLILSVQKGSFLNEKTNQMVSYSKTLIALTGEQKEDFVGYEVKGITGTLDHFEVIKNYVGKRVPVEIEMKPGTNDTFKMKFVSIDEIELQ